MGYYCSSNGRGFQKADSMKKKPEAKTNKAVIILISIILLAAFLRLARLDRADMLGDDAHYAFRAIGYLDYLSINTQTSPLVWFGFSVIFSFLPGGFLPQTRSG